MWFAKDADFDRRFRERFHARHEAAARERVHGLVGHARGSPCPGLLLDQYPRNAFRDTPRMYATDDWRTRRRPAIAAGTTGPSDDLAVFFYLPFGHSESLSDQERCVELAARLGDPIRPARQHHCDIVRRFGRFPHRNAIFGRITTAEEQRYLDEGGYKG